MPSPVKPEFHVKATADTRCPICGASVSVVYRENDDEVHWGGAGCVHLMPFDFHRHVTYVLNDEGVVVETTGGPIYAKFAEVATLPHK